MRTAAQRLYDGIGNEIFIPIIKEIKSRNDVKEIIETDSVFRAEFNDGSYIRFQAGFANTGRIIDEPKEQSGVIVVEMID